LALVGAVCGDEVLDVVDNEACDDGNTTEGDGCSTACVIEPQCSEGCLDTSVCAAGELCVGNPKTVPGATGQCEPKGNPPGTGDSCGSINPCPTGLACLGEYIWADGQGFCVAGWQAKDFYSLDNVAIPDAGATITSSVVACGLATVPVDIVVTLHLDHPRPEDLLVLLEDPNAQQGTVLDHEEYAGGEIVAFVGSGDDSVNGLWTLHVTDTVSGEAGELFGWSVYIVSNFD
jgi:cysteine-rich repeat protein